MAESDARLLADARKSEAEAWRAVEELKMKLTATQATLREERIARKEAEQKVLLGQGSSAMSSRRLRVSVSLALDGFVVFTVATPMTFFTLFGVIHDCVFGYALGLCPTSYCVLLLATLPTDAKLIRFIGALTLLALAFFATAFGIAAALIGLQVRCPYEGANTCRSVAFGAGTFALGCVLSVHPFVQTLRLLPGARRVPLVAAWRMARNRLGAVTGTTVTLVATPIVWALSQDEASFRLSPRASLHAYWFNFRVMFLGWAMVWIGTVGTAVGLGSSLAIEPVLPSLLTCAACFLLTTLFGNARARDRVHEVLGRLGMKAEVSEAAGIAAVLCGGLRPKEAVAQARELFSGLSFACLRREHFEKAAVASADMHDLVQPKRLGDVDIFLSHSWHDPVGPKWEALQKWCGAFEAKHGRSPVIWLDKACINQDDIAANLACLPVFLAGCQRLLVIAGPTYCERLWCVMEIFVFLRMGGHPSRISILPIRAAPEDSLDPKGAALAREATTTSCTASCPSAHNLSSRSSRRTEELKAAPEDNPPSPTPQVKTSMGIEGATEVQLQIPTAPATAGSDSGADDSMPSSRTGARSTHILVPLFLRRLVKQTAVHLTTSSTAQQSSSKPSSMGLSVDPTTRRRCDSNELVEVENEDDWQALMADHFADFEVENCKCFLESDKQRIFAIIEAAFGSLRTFDAVVRDLFGPRRSGFASGVVSGVV